MPSTVLWGKRRGDVQYGSRDYWRRNIPTGAQALEVSSTAFYAPGDLVLVHADKSMGYLRVVGIEPGRRLGVERA